jgi:twitching motility protein PilT
VDINQLLILVKERGASDLHIKVGNHPILRINGRLHPLTDHPILDQATGPRPHRKHDD